MPKPSSSGAAPTSLTQVIAQAAVAPESSAIAAAIKKAAMKAASAVATGRVAAENRCRAQGGWAAAGSESADLDDGGVKRSSTVSKPAGLTSSRSLRSLVISASAVLPNSRRSIAPW